jgi:hypothetical protein
MEDVNLGHGHIVPRVDGFKANCGGPTLCAQCAGELSDHTVRLNLLAQLYAFSFQTMIERHPETEKNGVAHRTGLMAVYMRALQDVSNAKP